MSIDIPSAEEFANLTKHRNVASVSIYVSAAANGDGGAVVHDTEAVRLALRSATSEALRELAQIDVPKSDRDAIAAHVHTLESDRDFWASQARTVAVFVSPEGLSAFRLMNHLANLTAVGDRFDVGPLVRSASFRHTGYVLALTVGDVRLLYLDAQANRREVALSTLPDDAADVLGRDVNGGRADRHKADGTLGPKVELRRYCSIVQDAVRHEIGDDTSPLVLAAGPDLASAYRAINTSDNLVEEGIEANPASLSLADLEKRGREVLDRRYAAKLAEWCETFGNRQPQQRASANLEAVAQAASAGQVESLLFDIDTNDEGVIDEFGEIFNVPEPGPTTYRLVDEIAARVLRTGGRVVAVRRADLPEDSPVAATFRATINA
ncbi:baeRF11 domain-containing protein [Gulosibacter molinativorax]|uniref:Nucleoid-associated protein n=1 Tax=Gulosibacter molinativorax TaxID=256821 RepID=A0ABT7C5A1_9MICO|nr:hypothetical protein [Gulosibacter molinativorax]MDJ1370368.1 hypothetical protein [Gulosibacter molinativorax]QUY61281.1 Hypotetical protein [Gulosibacter molinativorax]